MDAVPPTSTRPRSDASERLGVEQLSDLSQRRELWTRLADRSGNLFSTWEWADVWWRHFGDDRRLRLGVCLDATGAEVAILPLYEAFRSPVRVARLIGHGPGDELGPVCAPGERGVAEAMLRASADAGCDVLLADRLPGDREPAEGAWPEALGGVSLLRASSPVIDLAGLSWDEFLAQRSSNFRSQVRRKERKLVRDHDLSFRLAEDPGRLEADLDALFSLHRARWGEGGSGSFEGAREGFHREFAAIAMERGWLRLWLAEAADRPVAAWLGFRFGGADWYYQMGRDPDWDRSSVGFVLLAHTIRDAIEGGQRLYRLLRGDETYKSRFATGDPGLDTVACGLDRRGVAAVRAARLALALPPRLRGRVTRAVG